MILRMMAAPLMVANMLVTGAFTAGAVAGVAGAVGLYALRKRMKDRQSSTAGDAFTPAETSMSDPRPM